MFPAISPKFLIFYAAATGAVITLFTLTTAYGEAHLRAQEPIGGQYEMAPSALPPCLQALVPASKTELTTAPMTAPTTAPTAPSVLLVLQQSGRYVTGELLPGDASAEQLKTATQRPTWMGQWRDRRLVLTANLSQCRQPLTLDGTLENAQLRGTLSLGADRQPFQAMRLVASPTASPAH